MDFLTMLFWLLYVIGLLFGFYVEYSPGQPYPVNRGGRHFLMFIMIGLLGYKVFPPK